MHSISVGRQAVFDRSMSVVAYELLYRTPGNDECSDVDGDKATSEVIMAALTEIGLHSLIGDKIAFVNMTRHFLVNTDPLPFPPNQVVLEVLENIEIDDDLLQALSRLGGVGYRLALDDFVYRAGMDSMVAMADIVKVDIQAIPPDELPSQVQALRQWPVQLLAEKVETPEEFARCTRLGFDLFQGYFFCRPRRVDQRRIPVVRQRILQLLARLSDPNVKVTELATIAQEDFSLSFRLLKLINSAQFGIRRNVSSIQEAIVMLGLDVVRSIATVIVLSGLDDHPDELYRLSLIRAKMCELIAARVSLATDSAFTVGLLSTLDAMMDCSMERVMENLSLNDVLKVALIRQEGPLGGILSAVLAYERGDFDSPSLLAVCPKSPAREYLQSIRWAESILN